MDISPPTQSSAAPSDQRAGKAGSAQPADATKAPPAASKGSGKR
jgi:hypothetical protein